MTLAGLLSVSAGVLGPLAGWVFVAAAIIAPALVALGLIRPAIFLAALLLLRPILDQFSEERVTVGVGAINVNGATAVILLAVIVGLWIARSRFMLPAATRALASVVAVSALLALLALVNFGSQVGSLALAEIVRLAALLGVYVLAASVASAPERTRRLFAVVALSAVLPSLAAIYGVIAGTAPIAEGLNLVRAEGTFSGPNALGEFLALPALILICSPPRAMKRGWRIAALLIVLVALLLTYSRAGYAMLILGVMLVEYRRLPRRALTVALVSVGLTFLVPSVRERVLPTRSAASQSASVQTGGGYSSFSWRLNNWQGLLRKWAQSPLLGFGLRSTDAVNPMRASRPGAMQSTGFDAHNAAVRALVEGGIVLLAFWAALCAALIRQTGRLSRDRWGLQREARVVWAFWAATVFVALASDDPFQATALMYGLFALTGAVQGARQRSPSTEQTSPNVAPSVDLVQHRRQAG
jgi:O-antigen ligase